MFPHLGLTQWPFSVVPRPDECTFIAGRPKLREDLDALLGSLTRRDTSSLHLLWSWFGAGKTHSLHYVANAARSYDNRRVPVRLVPVYTEFPKGARNFLSLYTALIRGLRPGDLNDMLMEVMTSPRGDEIQAELELTQPDLAAAFRLIVMGSQGERILAHRWLRAEATPVAELRTVGISQKLTSSEQATQNLALLVRTFGDAERLRGRRGCRLLWLIDEFQRVESLPRAAITDINAGLHSLFNACPVGLSQMISFSGPPDESALPNWFSRELRDRIGVTKVFVLPPLTSDQALTFVHDVLQHYRNYQLQTDNEFFPFTRSACRAIIDRLSKEAELRPRNVMHIFGAVLDTVDPELESKSLDVVTPEVAMAALSEFVIITTDPKE